VDEVAGEQQGFGVPVEGAGVGQHRAQRGAGGYPAQGTVIARHQVRIGELQQAQVSVHGGHVTQPRRAATVNLIKRTGAHLQVTPELPHSSMKARR
jgi:hypothetical protein